LVEELLPLVEELLPLVEELLPLVKASFKEILFNIKLLPYFITNQNRNKLTTVYNIVYL
jgi:hypothetical protein